MDSIAIEIKFRMFVVCSILLGILEAVTLHYPYNSLTIPTY